MLEKPVFHATTICCVKKGNSTAIASDGQMTLGNSVVMKNNVKKLRKLSNGKILAGFAGSASDGLSLIEKLESSLEKNSGQLLKSCIELAKMWRSDKILRNLDAMLIVADKQNILILSGNGDVIEPENNIAAIGSGGQFAYAAALAMSQTNITLSAKEIAEKAVNIAGQICIYTNTNVISEEIENN